MIKDLTVDYGEIFETLIDEPVYIKRHGKIKKYYVDDIEGVPDDEQENEWSLIVCLVDEEDILNVLEYDAGQNDVCGLFKKVLDAHNIKAKEIVDVLAYDTGDENEDLKIVISYR